MTEPPPSDKNDASFPDALKDAVSAERAGQSHGAIGALLRQQIFQLRKEVVSNAGRGDLAVRRIARGLDAVIKEVYKLAPTVSGDICVCAVGGYGRRELAPYSDIDLLILHHQSVEEHVSPLLDFLLYPLWDSGCKNRSQRSHAKKRRQNRQGGFDRSNGVS